MFFTLINEFDFKLPPLHELGPDAMIDFKICMNGLIAYAFGWTGVKSIND